MGRLVAAIKRRGKREPFTIIRPSGGTLVKGRFKRTKPTEIPAVGSIQQADPKTQLLLPEAVRNRETVIVHTDTPLFGADVEAKREADNLMLRDRRFEVMMVSDWSLEGGFFEATCVRLGQ